MLVSWFWFLGAVQAIQWHPLSTNIPKFVTDHSPVLYLYSEERYLPGSIEEYIRHFMVSTKSRNITAPVCLSELTSMANSWDVDSKKYLTCREQWYDNPPWLRGLSPRAEDGYVDAPATLIVVEKPGDVVDAFWFYFYPFNLGPFVMGRGPFGNHLGDWEHTLTRFRGGKPELVWMSAHGGGTAYVWDSLERQDGRPALFSARGTHAQYVSRGRHSHDIPWHMLSDFTDRGSLWDPAKNYVAYTFDGTTLRPANGSVEKRELDWGDWLLYDGYWGNPQLDPDDLRQQWSPFEWRIIDGPSGPLSKNLMRDKPCERFKWWNFLHSCRIRNRVTPGEGLESEASGCDAILQHVPTLLKPIFAIIFYNGWLCFWIDRLWG